MQNIKCKSLVSIIVPVYKSEAFLEKCIKSILNQTYNNIELILVDDGSPDKSGDICDEYAKKDGRVTVIHKDNGGVCDARNTGLKIARGEYLMFADGDDWIAEDCVEYLLKILKDNDAEMAMTDSVFTTMCMDQNPLDKVRILSPEDAFCEIVYDKTPVGPWNKLYSMSVIKKHNLSFSVKWFGEGLYFSAMNAQLSNLIAYGHRKVYVYRKDNPNSGTTLREVPNGINALENIVYIRNHLNIDTRKTIAAANWHIYINNFLLISYIVGADATDEYKREFLDAKKYLKDNMYGVLIHSNVSIKEKIKIICEGIFPVLLSKYKKHKHLRYVKKLNSIAAKNVL